MKQHVKSFTQRINEQEMEEPYVSQDRDQMNLEFNDGENLDIYHRHKSDKQLIIEIWYGILVLYERGIIDKQAARFSIITILNGDPVKIREISRIPRTRSEIRMMTAVQNFLHSRTPDKSVDESFWSNIFGKADVKDAAHTQRRAHGYSHTGKDSHTEEEHNYIVFQGKKYYQDDIEYAGYHDLGELPRVEDGKLIIANPAWSM